MRDIPAAPLVLGIETSCDETGVGIVRGDTVLANEIASSLLQHRPFGGVIPEIAARAHLEYLPEVLSAALNKAQVSLDELDAVAVTAGPGLVSALTVGVAAAKTLALAINKPLYGMNHLVGHAYAAYLDVGDPVLPPPILPADIADAIVLLVSGGHTSLLKIQSQQISLLGETLDDAAGEAFDKVARLLGLAYPGGPEIDRAAKTGNPQAVDFPRALRRPDDVSNRFNFSFSGLKTAVSRVIGQHSPNDIAASFQEAVADVLTAKTVEAAREYGINTIVLGGGVAANRRLRELLISRAEGMHVKVPSPALCTDNGAMIAGAASWLIRRGTPPSNPGFSPVSLLPVTKARVD